MSRRRRSTPTPAQIWRILHATAREARIARREYAEAMREIARLDAEHKQAEEERRQADEERRQAEEERRQAEAVRRKAEAAQRKRTEEDRRQAEAARRKERERELDRLFRQIGGEVDNRWGRLAEGLVEEDLVNLLRAAGIGVMEVAHRVRTRRLHEMREYDLVAYGEEDAVVVEVKTNLKSSHVSRFERQMRDFREWRPDYARPRIRGAVACLTTEGRAAWTAEAAGLYLIQVLGGTARIVNAEGFRPTLF